MSAAQFFKLPGYVPTHDPTKVEHRKSSHTKQDANRNAKNQEVPLYALPRPPQSKVVPPKEAASMSLSHNQFPNHFMQGDIVEQFEPTFVKLDKQVLRFDGYFKESVVESRLENYKLRKLKVLFYLEDSTMSINEFKQVNSGTPQGVFLKRQMVTSSFLTHRRF